jgi:hypothetical protein
VDVKGFYFLKSINCKRVNHIFVVVGGQVFQQSVGIPMESNYSPLIADLFLYSYETEFM